MCAGAQQPYFSFVHPAFKMVQWAPDTRLSKPTWTAASLLFCMFFGLPSIPSKSKGKVIRCFDDVVPVVMRRPTGLRWICVQPSDKVQIRSREEKTGTGSSLLSLVTREPPSHLEVVSCSQLSGFLYSCRELAGGCTAGCKLSILPYLTLHTVHTPNFHALKHWNRLLPHFPAFSGPMDSFRLSAPYSAFLPTAERSPLEPYHIRLFLPPALHMCCSGTLRCPVNLPRARGQKTDMWPHSETK